MTSSADKAPLPRVLIVDDDQHLRLAIRTLLEDGGYEVFEASDGKMALARVEEAHPALVITDIVMPDMEGFELIRTLRARRPSVRIVALSGSVTAGTGKYLEIAERLGAHRVFEKPFRNADLLRAADELTRG